jgi:excisionase family DNA binding protein
MTTGAAESRQQSALLSAALTYDDLGWALTRVQRRSKAPVAVVASPAPMPATNRSAIPQPPPAAAGRHRCGKGQYPDRRRPAGAREGNDVGQFAGPVRAEGISIEAVSLFHTVLSCTQASNERLMSDERLLTVGEVATKLRVNPFTVRRWLREGRLRGFRLGSDAAGWRIRESALHEFVHGLEQGQERLP